MVLLILPAFLVSKTLVVLSICHIIQPGSTLKFVINATTDNLTFQAAIPSIWAQPLCAIPVTSLRTLDFTSVSGQSVQFWGMYLDGKLLVDSSQTPPSVPSIASTIHANQTAGFSIVEVDNPTSTQPRSRFEQNDLIICKSTASADSWHTYHSSLGYTQYINLNGTAVLL